MKKTIAPRVALAAALTVCGLPLSAAYGQISPDSKPAVPAAAPPLPAVPAVPAAPAPMASSPSMDELQSLLDQKQYSAAVKQAGKLLGVHGPEAASLSRFQITMIKGEAQVGLKAMSAAATTFKSAEKESKDPHEIALAKWTGELFARAKGTTYVPKTIGGGLARNAPIDLMDRDKRKDAFAAMLDDDLSALSPRLKTAVVSQSLGDIWPVLEKVVSLDQLDVIANGNDDKTTTVANSLLDHSRNLLSNALKGMWARVGDIDGHANYVTNTPTTIVVNGQYETQNVAKKNGLSGANKDELNNDIATCMKIHDAAETFIPLSKSDKDWGAILNDADRVAGKASDVLNADYGTSTYQSGTSFDNGTSTPFTTTPQFPGNGNALPQQIPQPQRPPKPPAKSNTVPGTKGNLALR